jgi:cytidylate kinase
MNLHDEAAISALAEKTQIDVAPASRSDGRACDVLVAGRDITWETRLPNVEANVSAISAIAECGRR